MYDETTAIMDKVVHSKPSMIQSTMADLSKTVSRLETFAHRVETNEVAEKISDRHNAQDLPLAHMLDQLPKDIEQCRERIMNVIEKLEHFLF